jgi:hypothetical protein
MRKLLVLLLSIICFNSFAQVIKEETKRKFTFGMDIFTDLWQDLPQKLDPKTLNPGINVFGSYNYIFGNSNVSFSPGLGLGVHNLFSSSFLLEKSDTTYFIPALDSLKGEDYKKSKLTVTYLDIPLEIRYKSKKDFRLAVGFKFGFLIRAHTKYKGDDPFSDNTKVIVFKKANIGYLEKNRYGFTACIGYKWLNLWGYYQLSTLFQKDYGPAMYPISLGLTIIPF